MRPLLAVLIRLSIAYDVGLWEGGNDERRGMSGEVKEQYLS